MTEITVVPIAESAFAVDIRGHVLTLDQPLDAGGTDAGPSPVEVFVGAVAGCVAHYAAGFLRRHDVVVPMKVTASYSMAANPARVAEICVEVHAPDVPIELRPKLLAVARHCTLHNTLDRPPQVSVFMSDDVDAEKGGLAS